MQGFKCDCCNQFKAEQDPNAVFRWREGNSPIEDQITPLPYYEEYCLDCFEALRTIYEKVKETMQAKVKQGKNQ